MKYLQQLVADVELLLQLEAAELAGIVLEQLNSLTPSDASLLNVSNFVSNHPTCHFSSYPETRRPQIQRHLAEAWGWLTAHGFIALDAVRQPAYDWYFVTRLGKRVANAHGLREYRKSLALQKDRLHPALLERCHPQYIRGELDSAVFEAYKTLEVRIRDAAKLPAALYGTTLARKAFDPAVGVLTDSTAEPSERSALADLMAGAIGSYKNPHSHRRIAVAPDEAAEMIGIASHLLNIVDECGARVKPVRKARRRS